MITEKLIKLLNESGFDPDIKTHILNKIKQDKESRDWSKLPVDFERQAVQATFTKIKPYLSKQHISIRVNASKASDYDDLLGIFEKV